MIIYKQFTFDSAHFLPNVPEGRKCREMLGHTYLLILYAEGGVKQAEGWVIDFGDIKNIMRPINDILDHHLLNEIPGLENPTAELLAIWLWNKIKPRIPMLKKNRIEGDANLGC